MDSARENASELTPEARHQIAHDFMSPIRSVSIIADLLAEGLQHPEPDLEAVGVLSTQLSTATDQLLKRLRDFAEGNRA